MRKMKIVADSSANLMELQSVDFASAPMKIITAEKEFVDSRELDVDAMSFTPIMNVPPCYVIVQLADRSFRITGFLLIAIGFFEPLV